MPKVRFREKLMHLNKPTKAMQMNGLVLRMILGIHTSYCVAEFKFNNRKLQLKTADLW